MAVSPNALKKGEKARDRGLGVTVKLKDETAHAHALTRPGAEPAGHGPGKAGWVRVPLESEGAPAAASPCDRVEESHRAVAPKGPAAELDAR